MEALICVLLTLVCLYMMFALSDEIDRVCYLRNKRKRVRKENAFLREELDKSKKENEKLLEWLCKYHEDDAK